VTKSGTALETRTDVLRVRLTATERQTIKSRATVCGLPDSTFVRQVALGSVPRARPQRLEKEAIYQLGRIGNNLNQLAHVANVTGRLDEEAHLRAATSSLLKAIRRLV